MCISKVKKVIIMIQKDVSKFDFDSDAISFLF